VIAIIILVIVVAVIVCGVIFGSVIAFLVINKIIRRRMQILQKKYTAQENVVADLDDPLQVSQSSVYETGSIQNETTTFKQTVSSSKGYNVV